MTPEHITCCRCLQTKPRAEFNLKPQAACKACINIYQEVYRNRNRRLINNKAKTYYQKNKERCIAYGATYRERRREELNAYQREYAKAEDRRVADRALRQKYSTELHDAYVRRSLCKNSGFKHTDVPLELIEAKRIHLKLTRAIKNVTDPRSQSQS